jgi:hypothetical protein
MNMQQKRKSKNIIIWRDSVAAGDDVFAPHEKKIKVENNETFENTLEKILATHYLPSIQGGQATWIVVGKTPLAVVAQQWSKPYYLAESVAHIGDLIEFTSNYQLEFKYWCQVEPNEVIMCIKQGRPLPDKFGRSTQ